MQSHISASIDPLVWGNEELRAALSVLLAPGFLMWCGSRGRGQRAKERTDQLVHLSSNLPGFKSFFLTSVELQMLTNSCVKLQTVHSIPLTHQQGSLSQILGAGELTLAGRLCDHKGLTRNLTGSSWNLYCTLEVDSYVYFVNKAKMRVCRDTAEPNWNKLLRESLSHLALPFWEWGKDCREAGID
ncbi:hypothetical protein P7K49_002512 [Saguinus oedipus]|uniref:Uncharacterized protein n=1 Tax=Saguinus oedipus TaxID=9490 RepID=A0ABQ9WHL2_SAGOE|nr:hypothetical protein P7K49_002512 [Saguinus oedipus]